MSEVREPPPRSSGDRRLTVWIDEQLSPSIAGWLTSEFDIDARSTRALGLTQTNDRVLFQSARDAATDLVVTKDSDFAGLVQTLGPPPTIVLMACGNSSNEEVRRLLGDAWPRIISHLRRGVGLVEVRRSR